MKRVLYIICVICLLTNGCTKYAETTTWEGFRVTKDYPIADLKPKLGKLPQAEIYRYRTFHYRTAYWPWVVVHY